VSCSECNRLRKIIQIRESNATKLLPLAEDVLHCGCVNPDLIKNSSGPAGHELCTKCAGWRNGESISKKSRQG
jgi:hypothetical protein